MIRRNERGSNWTDPEIVELLQLWSDELVQIELESSPRNQRVFDRISHVLAEKGIHRTGDQCREKIKKMKLEYRRIKDNHKMRPWKFYDVLDRVLSSRTSVSYTSLAAGNVIAKQVFQGDSPVQGTSAGSFGPASVGGFLFGHPPKNNEDQFEIKCEDIDESMVNSGVDPSEMYYGSGDDLGMETDGHSLVGTEEPEEREETHADEPGPAVNMSNRVQQNTPKEEDAIRERKRPRPGRASRGHAGVRCGSQARLDKALVRFIQWQQAAESRLLALEEARVERELQAEERRERREDLRAEQGRQHELRLFSMLTGALSAVKPGPPTQTDTSPSSLAHPSDSLSTAVAPSLSPSPAQATRTVSNLEPGRPAAPVSGEESEEVPGPSEYLSSRGNEIRQNRCILQEGYDLYERDAYHDTDNPQGVLKMCTSENKLCHDILLKRLTQPDMLPFDPSVMTYGDSKGQTFLREEVAKFLTDYARSPEPLSADNVVVMNGCTSVFSCLAAVICDSTDGLLIPTPFYNYIADDVTLYSNVKLFHVPLDCKIDGEEEKPFHLTVDKLEEGLRRAKKEGVVIRGVILMNPHNPLAEIYTPEEMKAFLEFAKRNKLHAILDEIYMLSIFDECVTFHSVLSQERLPDPQRTHILWGLSKDFAMSGIRVGTLFTKNKDIVDAVAKLGVFHAIPGTTQWQMARLLRDRAWINEEFLPENRRRLKAAHGYLTGELRSLGIPYLDRKATLYIWADFRKYLVKPTFEEELSLWRSFLRHKVVLTCGQVFSCSTPGWFRIVFADSMDDLKQGVKRIKETIKEIEATKSNSNPTAKQCSESPKEGSTESDIAPIENPTSSPCSKSIDSQNESGNSASGELVLVDRHQEPKSNDSLESLIGTLKNQISSSDWLEKNTPLVSPGENLQILDVFTALLQRARK